ncbi:hypothetical protein GJAV_G00210260 [Gymnothorax javanicus]|nr:hypothetical protein GJAV_G00210260 [Gymnothorax javanicus]
MNLRWLTALLLGLTGLLHWDGCMGERIVDMQEGPLFRAIGYPITMSCNVSGFSGPSEQNFEFSIFKPERPELKIQIASTADPSFAYAVYLSRVKSENIRIQRLTGSSVLFLINEVLDTDAGEYECATPNTDAVYFGSYSANTRLNVIRDTLTASTNPALLSRTEGDSIQLECEASTQTFQHTHLSVTWFLRSDGDAQPRPIISLARDFTLSPGKGFEDRYRAGFISLDKVQETTYRLSLQQLQLSDQGSLHCQASEWIQDPDRSWYRIAYRDTEAFTLRVQAFEVVTDSDAVSARIEAPAADLEEGDAMDIHCTVEAKNILDSYFSVSWMKEDREVAAIGSTGVPAVSQDYLSREKEGELKMMKKSDRDYLLTVWPVRREDSGSYFCRVWKEEKTAGVFTRVQSHDSSVKDVVVIIAESKLAVSTPNPSLEVNEGDVLRVICVVSGSSRQLSISWQQRHGQGTFTDVISLSCDGVMEVGLRYHQRAETGDVRALRSASESFTLEIANALPTDSGTYRCTVSECSTETRGSMKMNIKSLEVNAEVRSVASLIRADLKSRKAMAMENEEIELICRVKGPRVPLSVTWKFTHLASQSQERIVKLFHTGVITWWKNLPNYQLRTQVQSNEVSFILKVFRASAQEAGTYQCIVEAFLRQTQKASKPSNMLAVHVRKPDSRLSISAGPRSPLQLVVGSDVRLECSILSVTMNASRFAVSWVFQPEAGQNKTILQADKDFVLNVEAEQKYSLIRRKIGSYELVLRQAGTGDSGLYYCMVEEWLQDPHGDWAPLASTSTVIQLLISPQESHFSVTKVESKLTVRESEQVLLNCTLGSGSILPASQYSVTWFFVPVRSSERMMLMKLSHEALLDYTGVNVELMKRIHLYRPSLGSFSLSIENMDSTDSGHYSCQVDEYQLDCEGKWLQRATDHSGVTSVRVLQTESNLHVLKDDAAVTINNQQGSFTIICNITSYSSISSAFEVTWWHRQLDREEAPQPIFRASRDSTLQHLDKGRERLLFGRPQTTLFTLSFPDAELSDSGQYYCHVEEWLLSPRNTWRKIAEDTSGNLAVSFQKQAHSKFAVQKPDVDIRIQEGDSAVLQCQVSRNGVKPSSHYSFTWFFIPMNSSERISLIRFNHEALLDYNGEHKELMKRMHLKRPSLGSFSLIIENMDSEDSGRYSCQVDEYQLDCEGNWQQNATDHSGFTTVTVHRTGGNLHVLKRAENVTMNNTLGNFTIICNITSYSSDGSVFEVTWWHRLAEKGEALQPIFRARRDSTLQHLDKSREHLLFGRPQPTVFTLTVPDAEPSDSGQYYCHVEEWLLSPRNTWRKIAEDTSGYLAVSFPSRGAAEMLESECNLGIFPVVLIIVIILLILVTGALSYKLWKAGSKSAKKNSEGTLWAESNPLKP